MNDKERVIKAILNAMDCDFGFVCAVPGNWLIPDSIVFKEESGLLRFINHLGASKVDVVKQGDMFYDLPVQPELLLHFNDVNLRLTIRRKDTIKDHYLSVVKERDELKRKVYGDPKKYHVGQDDCLHDVLRKQNVQATDANVIMLLKYNSNVLEYGRLVPGMTLTIEPMLNMGTWKVVMDQSDGWTVYTEDRLPSAQWEYTILITESEPEILAH